MFPAQRCLPVLRVLVVGSGSWVRATWKSQRRLHGKYQQMTARGKPAAVAIVAVARELAGFLHAEMTR